MTKSEFARIKEFDDMLEVVGVEVGTKIIVGELLKSQKDTKEIGDVVSYYEVVKVNPNGNIVYMPKYERLTLEEQ